MNSIHPSLSLQDERNITMSKPRPFPANGDPFATGSRFAPPRPLLPRHLARIEPANDTAYEQSYIHDVDYGYPLSSERSQRIRGKRLSAGVAFLIAVPLAAALAAASAVAVVWVWSSPQRTIPYAAHASAILPPPAPAEPAQVTPPSSMAPPANFAPSAATAPSLGVPPIVAGTPIVQAPVVQVQRPTQPTIVDPRNAAVAGAVVATTAPTVVMAAPVPQPALSSTDLRSGINSDNTAVANKQPLIPEFSTGFPSAIEKFVERAEELLARGDISSARLFLERASEAGNGRALFRLAETYDPRALQRWNVVGQQGSTVKARKYYEQAAAKGLAEAKDRLIGLP
jgi:hypothetical protein